MGHIEMEYGIAEAYKRRLEQDISLLKGMRVVLEGYPSATVNVHGLEYHFNNIDVLNRLIDEEIQDCKTKLKKEIENDNTDK